jgi:SAM-dependent methyltransferase
MDGFSGCRASFFNSVPERYDRCRPSYPLVAVQSMLDRASSPGSVLEIGSGTGKFTERLVELGHAVTCVEPGEGLIHVAAAKLGASVSFLNVPWGPGLVPDQAFSAVFSAQAFHWIGPAGLPAVAQALQSGGVFAMVWNSDRADVGDLSQVFDPIWDKYRPDERIEESPSSRDECAAALSASLLFRDYREDEFQWSAVYSAEEYAGLLSTYSDVGS